MATLSTRVILAKGIKMDREYKNVLNYTENQMLSLLRSQTHLVREIATASFVNPTRNFTSTFYIFRMFTI